MDNMNGNEDEINLVDIVRVIVKRKTLIIVLTLLSLLFALGANFMRPRAYRISTLLDIGNVRGGLVESKESIKSKILKDYIHDVKQEMNIVEVKFPKINISTPKRTDLVEIWLKMADVEKGKDVLQQITRKLLDDHEKALGSEREKLGDSIKRQDTVLSLIEHENERIKKQLKGIMQQIDLDNISLNLDLVSLELNMQHMISNNEIKKVGIENKKTELKSKHDLFQETIVVMPPSASENPVSPSNMVIIVFGLIAGLLASMFLAFFIESVEKYGNEKA